MIFKKKLTDKHFYLSILAIFLVGLIFLSWLYYTVNIQYQKPQSFSSGPVTTLPKSLYLSLDQPGQDALSFTGSTVVSGTTKPRQDILVSTDTNDFVIQSKADGSFSTVLELDEGINRITAVVFESTGDSRTAERTVYYSKEKI